MYKKKTCAHFETHNEKRHPESSGHLLSTMKTKYYFLAKKSFTVDESITSSLNV